MTNTRQKRGMFSIWLQAVRVFSLPASIVPVLVGAGLAAWLEAGPNWWLLGPVALAAVLFQAGTNMVSDYYDFVNQVDKDYTFGGSRVIVEGWLGARQVLWGGLAAFALGCAIGLVFVWLRGWPILAIAAVGLVGGIFYSASPVGYKYVALGDAAVFVLMGPLMVLGAFFVLTGRFAWDTIWVSLPVGCLVAAILHANNTRDIVHDRQAGTRTVAGLLGHRRARYEYYILVGLAYAAVAGMAALRIVPLWSLGVLATAPLAWKNIERMAASREGEPESIATLDVESAKLHLAFGVVLSLSLFVGAWVS